MTNKLIVDVELTDINIDKNLARLKKDDDLVSIVDLIDMDIPLFHKESIYTYLKTKDTNKILANYVGVSADEKYILAEHLEPLSQMDRDSDLSKLVSNLFEVLVFCHSNGWYNLDLGEHNVYFCNKTLRFKVLNLSSLKNSNYISNKSSYFYIQEDYRRFNQFIKSVDLNGFEGVPTEVLNELDLLSVCGQGEFYSHIEKSCGLLNIHLDNYYTVPWFAPMLDREHQRHQIGNAFYTLVKGYSGVGKSSLLNSFLQSPRSNELNTIVIKSKSTRRESTIDEFVTAFNTWVKNLKNSDNQALIELLEKHFSREDDILGKVLDSNSNRPSKTSQPNKRVQGKIFKYQLINFIKKVSKVLNQKLYIIYDNFNFSSRVTIDFLRFCYQENVGDSLKSIVFYKEFKGDDYHNSLKLVSVIENDAPNVEKISIPPFAIDEVSQCLGLMVPPKMLMSVESKKVHELTKGNPLFVKSLMLARKRISELIEGDFLHLVNTVLKELSSNGMVYNLLKTLAVYGKPLDIAVLKDLSECASSVEFDHLIVQMVSVGILNTENNKIWFSHDKYVELTLKSISTTESKKISYKIASYLLDRNYEDVTKTDLIYDAAYHSSQSLSLAEVVYDAQKIISVCFSAALRCRDVGAIDEALNFINHSLDASKVADKKFGEVDINIMYAINFEKAFLQSAVGKKEDAISSFLALLKGTSTEREKLEVEVELVRLYSEFRDQKSLVKIINDVLARYQLGNLSENNDDSYIKLVNSINQSLLGRSISNLKEGQPCLDEKEHIFQEMLSIVVKNFMFVNHRLVNWVGLLIMKRTLDKGSTRWSVIGVSSYAHYLNAFLKDFSGAKGFLDLADQVLQKHNVAENSFERVFLGITRGTLNAKVDDFKKEIESMTKSALQNDSTDLYELITIASLLHDISTTERPSYVKDRMYIVSKIVEKQGSQKSILKEYIDLFSNHLECLCHDKQDALKPILLDESDFYNTVKKMLELKVAVVRNKILDGTYLEFEEKSSVGGFFVESELMFWAFLYESKEKIRNKSFEAGESSSLARRLALLARNSIETIHVTKQKIKLSYSLDSFLSSKYSSASIADLRDGFEVNRQNYSPVELSVGFDFLSDFYQIGGLRKESLVVKSQSIKLASDAGIDLKDLSSIENVDERTEPFNDVSELRESSSSKSNSIGANKASDKVRSIPSDSAYARLHKVETTAKNPTNASRNVSSKVNVSPEKLKEIRLELIIHLFELDSKLLESSETPWEAVERLVKVSKLLIESRDTKFNWYHHGENELDFGNISSELSKVTGIYKILSKAELSSVGFNSMIDNINNSGNLILNFRITFKSPIKGNMIAAAKEYLNSVNDVFTVTKYTDIDRYSFGVEFQIRKKSLVSKLSS